ncbi:MAG: HEAT repeat domain-containing protein [Saprospiraceae bacterium]|nr:HEAT repeat domain-containing protein [Saprospiraceae bacterium]
MQAESAKTQVLRYFSLLIVVALFACHDDSKESPEITSAAASDFEEEDQISVRLASDFRLSLWAPGPLLQNAVAIAIDDNGIAYVSETSRRKSSDIDVRQHRDWMVEDLALESRSETRAFHLRKLDPALSDQNTWQEDFNNDGLHDWRDLTVQTEIVRRIWDADGDGRADASAVFASEFQEMLTGVAAGVMAWKDDIFLTVAPDVWRLQDRNHDGVADERVSISHGYAVHIAYAGHDMSGLTMGPDGKIYWSIGDMGLDVIDLEGKHWPYPHEGSVMRCNPDGSEFEVFAHGVRNPQELAFDAYGNLISVDNDGDHAEEHERFIHILEGSDTGWRTYWQFGKYHLPGESYRVWIEEGLHLPHFPGQAAYVLPPLALAPDGPAGLAYNPGTALGERWNGYFFASYFTGSSANSKIQAFKLDLKGSTYKVSSTEDVLVGIVSTGISFGPDGSLFINDWKDSYDKKPEGRIWRLDVADEYRNPQRKRTQELLKSGLSPLKNSELQELLDYADMRIRLHAQFELVQRHDDQALADVARDTSKDLARLHGIWGLGQLARKGIDNKNHLIGLLHDQNIHVRAQSAKVLGESPDSHAVEDLVSLLTDPSDYVILHAAEALGKFADSSCFDALIKVLEERGLTDPHLRHAVIYALSRLGVENKIVALSTHPSTSVRLGATVALRYLASPGVQVFLGDADPLVVAEAARAIHDDLSIPVALSSLAKLASSNLGKNEALIRRVINANLRIGDAASAKRLVTLAENSNIALAMRSDALWALGYWPSPPLLDRVEGRYRKLPDRSVSDAKSALEPVVQTMFTSPHPEIRVAVLQLIGRIGYVRAESTVAAVFESEEQPHTVRLAALRALGDLQSSHVQGALTRALASAILPIRETALEMLSDLDLAEDQKVNLLSVVMSRGSIREQQRALAELAKMTSPNAENLLHEWMDRLTNNTAPGELQLDILNAIQSSPFTNLRDKAGNYLDAKDAQNQLVQFSESLYGGDSVKGRQIFYQNPLVQCIRCHRVGGQGGEVGPDLTRIATVLNREDLLISMVDPNARIAPGYGNAVINLRDGSEKVGTVQDHESSIILREADGLVSEIPSSDIESRESLPSAMLPVANILTKSEIRDLMAFLSTLR